MHRYRVGAGALGILLLLWAVPVTAWAQTPASSPPAQAPQTSQDVTSKPIQVDLNKIRNALVQEPLIRFDEIKVKYYVEIYGRQARFWDFVGEFNFRAGPVPHAGMTHQEFLDQVAPKNMYFGSPTGGEIAKVAAETVAFLGGTLLLNKLRDAYKHATTDNERKRIQAQIDRELAALAGKK